MLKAKLQSFWDSNKFATSWIVGTKNLERTLENIKEFAQKIINIDGLSIDNNPDFKIIKRDDTKYISVDQVRDLQKFLHTTSAVGEYKFAVIYEAEFMNNNSANSCLKILEEPPRQSYLFLLTSCPSSLKATIKSRCHKIYLADESIEDSSRSYIGNIQNLLSMDTAQKVKWLQDISNKSNLKLWEEFCENSIEFISKNIKNQIAIDRFENIHKMIIDANNFDLDKKHIAILILESLMSISENAR